MMFSTFIKGLSIAVLLCSCERFVQVDQPADQLIKGHIFTNGKTAQAALNGLYSDLMFINNNVLNGGTSIFAGLSADELVLRVQNQSRMEFANNQLSVTNTNNELRLWRESYERLYQANVIIEGCENNSYLDEGMAATLLGEALFIRAFLLFNLVNFYGDVPLILTTDSDRNALMPRTPINDVYAQILQDLSRAEGLLKHDYPSADRSRPNKATVQALLARVYLYLKDWEASAQYASTVIGLPDYELEDLHAVFQYNSREVIWQLYPANESFKATAEAQLFLPGTSATSLPSLLVSEQVLGRFGPGDQRATEWINEKVVNGIGYQYPYKYRIRRGEVLRGEYNVLFRLAEQFLIRAEARLNLGDRDGALADLNVIRERAGLHPIPSLTPDEFRGVLIEEKSLEFFAECGHRWFDLKRWDLADKVLAPIKGAGWQSTDVLYPIPQSELTVNPFLNQNFGYE